MSVAVVQIGARNHYLTAHALHGAGKLQALFTDAYARTGSWKTRLAKVLMAGNPEKLRVLGSRKGDIPDSMVRDAWAVTALSIILRGLPVPAVTPSRVDATLAKLLTRFAIDHGLGNATSVYGYSTGCPELFLHARECGMVALLDQASATVRTTERIMRGELERWRGWSIRSSLDLCLYEKRQNEELEMANRIFAPSEFVRTSLLEIGVPQRKIVLVPYGLELEGGPRTHGPTSIGAPLRVLYLGNVGLQKGVQYLLDAAKLLGGRHYEFRIVGAIGLAADKIGLYRDFVSFTGRVPRNEVSAHYDWADVLVLPTLCDGFAMVQLEALARGIPVVATTNCGAVVADRVHGFIVPPASAVAIADSLRELQEDRELLSRMSGAALARAREYSGEAYARRLLDAIERPG